MGRMGDGRFSTWNSYCSGHVDQKARLLLRAVLHFSFGQFPENSETPRDCGNVMQYVLSDYKCLSAQVISLLFQQQIMKYTGKNVNLQLTFVQLSFLFPITKFNTSI